MLNGFSMIFPQGSFFNIPFSISDKKAFMANITTLSVFTIIRNFQENNGHFYFHKLISPFLREAYSPRKAVFPWNFHLSLLCPSWYHIQVNDDMTSKELKLLYCSCKLPCNIFTLVAWIAYGFVWIIFLMSKFLIIFLI